MSVRGVLILVLLAAGAPPGAHADSPPAPVHRALLISIDGLRPDVLLRADAPTLRGLMKRGSYSMWARTTASSVTLPSHVSMLTGVELAQHGIDWNSDLPLLHPIYPRVPTLFERARNAGYTTALVAGKSKFAALAKPGSLDWWFLPESTVVADQVVADTAVRLIERHRPNVLFVHLAGVDSVGHAFGWGSAQQVSAASRADRYVGRILAALRGARLLDSTLVLVTSDHGGAGKRHGPDDPRSRSIPWIAAGPGIRPDFDLTTLEALTIQTEDTFATICWMMGVPVPDSITGRPVTAILAGARDTTPASRER